MPPTTTLCSHCQTSRALILRPKNHDRLCKACFLSVFETEIHTTITTASLFHRGERIAIGASGGKDSTVLASVLQTLNARYDYGLELMLLSIDEGITGYRDDSLETVKRNAVSYGMPLHIVGYDALYGWTMDQVVAQVGNRGNCTYCGVFRRQALDRGAAQLGVRHVVTGHNADDVAETVLMNLLRGDLPRLARATGIVTASAASEIKRSKPLKYAYEKEIVLYAHHKGLEYFSTECIYSPEAFRGSARALIKNLERVRPSAILDVVRSGEDMAKLVPGGEVTGTFGAKKDVLVVDGEVADDGVMGGCGSANGRSSGGEMASMEAKLRADDEAQEREIDVTTTTTQKRHHTATATAATATISPPMSPPRTTNNNNNKKPPKKQHLGKCSQCGYLSSQAVCKACMLLQGLNKSRPKTEIRVGGVDEEKERV